MTDETPRSIKLLGLITALLALSILSFGMSLSAGTPVRSGGPPPGIVEDGVRYQAEWTPEAAPDATVSLNSTLNWQSTWMEPLGASTGDWWHGFGISSAASAHTRDQDVRAITGQRTEVGIETAQREFTINPLPLKPHYFGGRSDPEHEMVIREKAETIENVGKRAEWNWKFTKLGATASTASHYSNWALLIPPDRSCQATLTESFETIWGGEVTQRWNMTIDPLPDPEGLSDEELADYGIIKESWGQYNADGAVHLDLQSPPIMSSRGAHDEPSPKLKIDAQTA